MKTLLFSAFLAVAGSALFTETPAQLLIDLDGGVDDAVALFLAAKHPQIAKIVALTTVAGNTREANVYKNVMFLLKAMGQSYPVFRSQLEPKKPWTYTKNIFYYGLDGLGDLTCRKRDENYGQEETKSAAEAIVFYANKYLGKLDLVCLGPLSNVAAALAIDPQLGSKLNSVVIMGGSPTALGNAGPVSEFNLDYDPEAAKYVLENIPMTRWVTWEVGLSTTRSWEGWHSILEKHSLTAAGSSVRLSARSNCGVDDADGGVNLAALVLEMEKYLVEKWPNNGVVYCDPVAMFVYLFPKIAILKESKYYCTVETKGEFTRGMFLVDRGGFVPLTQTNCVVVEKVDIPQFWNHTAEALR